MTISVFLPLRVVSTMNQRVHWSEKARRAKEQRFLTCALVKRHAVSGSRGDGVPVMWRLVKRPGANSYGDSEAYALAVTLTRIAPRPLDGDNLQAGFKHIRDGVADALGLRDDSDPRVTWEYAQQRGKPREYAARVEIRADASRTQSAGVNAEVKSP